MHRWCAVDFGWLNSINFANPAFSLLVRAGEEILDGSSSFSNSGQCKIYFASLVKDLVVKHDGKNLLWMPIYFIFCSESWCCYGLHVARAPFRGCIAGSRVNQECSGCSREIAARSHGQSVSESEIFRRWHESLTCIYSDIASRSLICWEKRAKDIRNWLCCLQLLQCPSLMRFLRWWI